MLEIEEMDEQTVVKPGFDIVASNVGELRDVILDLASKGVQTVALDLSEVNVIDSMGIGVIVACLKTLKQRGGDLLVSTGNEDFIKLFKILKLDFILVDPRD